MYKLIPILLFSFLIAEENQDQHFIQSDSLDFIKTEEMLDEEIDVFKYKLQRSKSFDEDKFLINVDREVYDVKRVDTSYSEMKDSILNEMKNNYPKKNRHTSKSIGMGQSYWLLEVYAINVEVNVDKSIKLDNNIKQTIVEKINNIGSFTWEIDEIIFNSVDINRLKNNTQLTLNRDDIYDDSWAVIIGIDDYQNLSNLDYAVADAEAVKDMLIAKFDYPEENVTLLLNEEANKANIVNVISDVSLKAGENDRILVFFAGHGETMDLPAGGEMGFLLPVDGNENNLYASAIRMDDLKDFSYLSKSKHMLFLVDACYGGLAAVGTRSLEQTNTPNYLEKISNIKSRQIITAGGKEEKVVEKSEWGHSAYTKNLLSGLNDELADINEDGYITALELGSYLSEKVTFDSESRQTPQLRRLTSDEGEFVFFGVKQNLSNNQLNTQTTVDDILSNKKNIRIIDNNILFQNFNLGFSYFKKGRIFHIQKSLDDTWSIGCFYMLTNYVNSYTHSTTSTIITPAMRYKIQSFKSNRIIAQLLFGTPITYLEWEDTEENISGNLYHMDMMFGLATQFIIWKNLGVGFGIARYNNFRYKYSHSSGTTEFGANNYELTPFFTFEIFFD